MKERVVKSAVRALQVLEFFDEMRTSASVMEVARALKYPQSSTSGLLKSLVTLGYLSYDAHARLYAPTHRVALLGSWIPSPNLGEGKVVEMMEELGELTRETVILGEQTGLIVRYIYVVPSRQLMRLHVGPGLVRPLASSGMGRLFLSSYPVEKVRELLKRINADLGPGEQIFRLADMAADFEDIRSRGYAVSINRITAGAGVVATLLPHTEGFPPLAIAIGGFSETVSKRAAEFAQLMKSAINRHLA
ncbi:MAG: IclR family transcriptional regulator [Bradyrhizobiaceae bacterium]|nr:MAG: IclR family transcriptional regulator [Bradyrhizobiaceae bacterium]